MTETEITIDSEEIDRRFRWLVDTVTEYAAESETGDGSPYDVVTSWDVTRVGGGDGWYAIVQLARRAVTTCPWCDQDLGRPGTVAWIDPRDGRVQGGHNHQHGCGAWNAPVEVMAEVSLADPDDGAMDRLADQMYDLARGLDKAVELAQTLADAERQTRVDRDHADVIAHLVELAATDATYEASDQYRLTDRDDLVGEVAGMTAQDAEGEGTYAETTTDHEVIRLVTWAFTTDMTDTLEAETAVDDLPAPVAELLRRCWAVVD